MLNKIKFLLGVALLLFQLIMIAYARFVPTRYFCWGPYDSLNYYKVEATVGGKKLTPMEIYGRYRINANGVDHRAISHVLSILQKYEENYGVGSQAHLRVIYSVNGGEDQVWEWPTY